MPRGAGRRAAGDASRGALVAHRRSHRHARRLLRRRPRADRLGRSVRPAPRRARRLAILLDRGWRAVARRGWSTGRAPQRARGAGASTRQPTPQVARVLPQPACAASWSSRRAGRRLRRRRARPPASTTCRTRARAPRRCRACAPAPTSSRWRRRSSGRQHPQGRAGRSADAPDPAVFVEDDERALWSAFAEIAGPGRDAASSERRLRAALCESSPSSRRPVDRFFDKVLVMDKDPSACAPTASRCSAGSTPPSRRIADFRQLAVVRRHAALRLQIRRRRRRTGAATRPSCSAARAPTWPRWRRSACRCRPGFTITTEVCRQSTSTAAALPEASRPGRRRRSSASSELTGRRFGDAGRPAPGLGALRRAGVDARDDGHDPQPRAQRRHRRRGWRAQTGNARFAWDCYRRFVAMYGEVVMGVVAPRRATASARSSAILDDRKRERRRRATSATSTDAALRDAGRRRSRPRSSAAPARPFPDDAAARSCGARSARCSARGTTRAPTSTAACTASTGAMGTAVNVQAMVFGNLRRRLRAPASLHPQPGDRRAGPVRRVPVNAQGEDVVAGIRTPEPIAELAQEACRRRTPSWSTRRAAPRGSLPRHAGHRVHDPGGPAVDAADPQRQAHRQGDGEGRRRPGRRGRARRRAARSLRIDPDKLDEVLHPTIDPKHAGRRRSRKGLPASPGAAIGRVVFTANAGRGVGASAARA